MLEAIPKDRLSRSFVTTTPIPKQEKQPKNRSVGGPEYADPAIRSASMRSCPVSNGRHFTKSLRIGSSGSALQTGCTGLAFSC